MNGGSPKLELYPDATGLQAGGAVDPSRRLHQPKAALCRMLSVLWFFPSAGALLILTVTEPRWLRAEGLLSKLAAITLEQWTALLLLLLHPALAWLAWHWRQTEPWKELAPEPEPEADDDLRDPK